MLSNNLILITLADFIVRSAYQMGKTPLLPIFAFSLGANDAYLGFIISVSTMTGMVLKPLIGILSDRWGRRIWLLFGTIFFALMPFLYRFVHTPEELFTLRIFHGLATAIYGPVTLAYVAQLSQKHIAQRLAWFSIARSGGYVIGPILAGWLLLTLSPITVFTIIGILSSFAFLPVLLLDKAPLNTSNVHLLPFSKQVCQALASGAKQSSIWLAGSIESVMYIALYAIKAFLPIYAISAGFNIALIGTFFALQELIHMAIKPLGGWISDRVGHLTVIVLGMTILGIAFAMLTHSKLSWFLIIIAIVIGIGQACISPSILALVSVQADKQYLGAAMGLVGTLKNAGKVAGPVLAGIVSNKIGFTNTLNLISIMLFVSAVFMGARANTKKPKAQRMFKNFNYTRRVLK